MHKKSKIEEFRKAFPGIKDEEIPEAMERLGAYLDIATKVAMGMEEGSPEDQEPLPPTSSNGV